MTVKNIICILHEIQLIKIAGEFWMSTTTIKNQQVFKKKSTENTIVENKVFSIKNFFDIYKNYSGLVYSQLLSKTNDPHAAEEMCQEIFITVNKKMKEIKNIKAWLFGTIKQYLNNYYKNEKKKSNTENIEDYFDSNLLSFVNGFRDARIILNECFEKIIYKEEIEKIIYEMIARQNYSYRETAKILHISKPKLIRIYNNITNQLLKKLREKGIKKIEDLL